MSRDDRLLAGHGFAVFSRDPSFAARTVARYLELDPAAKHVVYIHHPGTSPTLTEGLRVEAEARGAVFQPVAWAEYGAPANVRAVAALPPEHLVFVSADHHLSVHDRLDKRRGYIRRKGARKKIAIDAVPFEVFPWRVYFPFAFFDTGILGYHHSYAIEQDYERFLDGALTDNPCAPTTIAAKTWRHAVVDQPAFFVRRPSVRVIRASEKHRAEYARVRDKLFDGEKSIASVKSKLGAWIQERYPDREIPDLKRLYSEDVSRIVRTDLPFDQWLVGEIHDLMKQTDELLGLYDWHQREAGE